MANPQKEDGYTPIANELLEVVYSTNFSATQLKILLFIMRYTYGFSRKEHAFSLSFLSKGTGISRRYISAELKSLINNNVIIVIKEHTTTEARILKFNKNYESWTNYRTCRTNKQQVNSSSTGEEKQDTTDEEQITRGIEELSIRGVEEFSIQDKQQVENNQLKQNIKQDNRDIAFLGLKDLKKEIRFFLNKLKDLKKNEVKHGTYYENYPDVYPAYSVIDSFSRLPPEEKLGTVVEIYLSLYPEQRKKFGVGAAATAHDIFTETLNYPLCGSEEDILKEILYHEGGSLIPWTVRDTFKDFNKLQGSLGRMRYEIDRSFDRGNFDEDAVQP